MSSPRLTVPKQDLYNILGNLFGRRVICDIEAFLQFLKRIRVIGIHGATGTLQILDSLCPGVWDIGTCE